MKIMNATRLFAVLALATGGTAMADAPRTLQSGRPACGNVVRSRGKKGPSMAERQATLACEVQTAAAQAFEGSSAQLITTTLRSAVASILATTEPATTVASVELR